MKLFNYSLILGIIVIFIVTSVSGVDLPDNERLQYNGNGFLINSGLSLNPVATNEIDSLPIGQNSNIWDKSASDKQLIEPYSTSVNKQVITPVNGSLTVDEISDLLFMREEEKLARDVYATLYKVWGLKTFSTISSSEKTHMARIGELITRYGLTDPVRNDTPGVFKNESLQKLYSVLITKGKISQVEALKIGVLIEEKDIADLEKAILRTNKSDIKIVYKNLVNGSRNHLKAFSSLIK